METRSAFIRVTDETVLRHALDQVVRANLHAVGDEASVSPWHREIGPRLLSMTLRQALSVPSPVSNRKLHDKTGVLRKALLPTVWDRTVGQAIASTVGFLTKSSANVCVARDRQDALAAAARLAERSDRWFLLPSEISDPFGNVPHYRAIKLFARSVPDAKLIRLVGQFLPAGKKRGLVPAQPVSRTLLDIYLTDVLDKRWSRKASAVVLIRCMGNLLLMGQSEGEITSAKRELMRILKDAGLTLARSPSKPVDVRRKAVSFAGMTFTAQAGKVTAKEDPNIRFDIADDLYLGQSSKRRSAKSRSAAGRTRRAS